MRVGMLIVCMLAILSGGLYLTADQLQADSRTPQQTYAACERLKAQIKATQAAVEKLQYKIERAQAAIRNYEYVKAENAKCIERLEQWIESE